VRNIFASMRDILVSILNNVTGITRVYF